MVTGDISNPVFFPFSHHHPADGVRHPPDGRQVTPGIMPGQAIRGDGEEQPGHIYCLSAPVLTGL